MLRFGVCFKRKHTDPTLRSKILLTFPENPDILLRHNHTIDIVTTTYITPQLLQEMLSPTEKLVHLANLARTKKHLATRICTLRLLGYTRPNVVFEFKRTGKLYLSYTLYGIDQFTGTMINVRIYPVTSDLPDYISEIRPPTENETKIPNILSIQAEMYLEKCIGCSKAPPLGADKLCSRCLLLNEL